MRAACKAFLGLLTLIVRLGGMGLRDWQQVIGSKSDAIGRRRKFAGSIPRISTISMPDSHGLPSLQAQAASTRDAAIGCQDENDAAGQRQEIEESLRKQSAHILASWNQPEWRPRAVDLLRPAA